LGLRRGALLVALLAGACAAEPVPPPPSAGQVDVRATLSGAYLAGRHAQAERDMGRAADLLGRALKMDPDSHRLRRRTFTVLLAEGRVDEAVVLARGLIGGEGDASFSRLTLAVERIGAGRFDEALKHLDALPKDGIMSYLVPLLGAWAEAGKDDFAAAREALKPLADKNGSLALYDLHVALVQDRAGNTRAAVESYRRVADGQTGLSLRLVQLLGSLYERSGKQDEARTIYDDYLKVQPRSNLLDAARARLDSGVTPAPEVASAIDGAAEGLFGLAGSLRQQNARETALLLARMALYLRPDFPMQQILLADLLESDNRLDAANRVYEAINPESPYAWTVRLRIASNLDQLDQTEEALSRLAAMAGDQPGQAEALISMGDILRGHERFEEAVKAYDRAVARIEKLEKRHWRLLYSRGIALERSKNWPRAEADFLKALEFEPDQPFLLNYLGYSWVEKGLHLERARDMIKTAVKLRPNDGYIVDSLGWVLYQGKQYEEAVRELERAVELRPEDPIINDHLGDALWQVGRLQEARFQWLRALGLDPEPDTVPAIEKTLEQGLPGGV
jgi:tetratricopeptide (TPR) repeat protein